ncbi:GDP-mannose-dependent alpha-(1-2)-phosphatidylinositol mannosyltransferase [Pseudoruegeria aquimaris]|uniref:GDP-mannose-dependent alpha-(1-2)-phosphatidylinositol mannosyltransferase n=1 Tax=Pseudoruegeria aquimaris TaxID=393663 RepID=A0A1Y5TMY9_9RHOB|nr:glycosyltransferase [Pseudoruegeria aquimaris]SLN67898.1 GDP-mannose-dependent alpha-(1-2)-phosphatidylinositol mannosyltransferase [Pseudoruegeria aquimaris]
MTKQQILHLMDDTTAGGVMRVVDYITGCPAIGEEAEHRVHVLPRRGAILPPQTGVDVIVSHLTVSWRALPALIALRAMHPAATLIHVEHSYTAGFAARKVRHMGRFCTLLRTAYAMMDGIVAVSRDQRDWMLREKLARREKLFHISPCVDLADFTALPAPEGAPRVFGLIGRLHEQKGFATAINAFKATRNPALRLKIFGAGPLEEELKALAEGDARISFEGFRAAPAQAMAEVDCVLMPSRWEAFGLVAQEGLAAGRTVLVADVDGLRDQIADGALKVEVGTCAAWQDAIETVASGAFADRPRPVLQGEARFAARWLQMLDTLRPAQADLQTGTQAQAAPLAA